MPPKFQQPLLPRAKPAAPRREAVALAYEHGRVAPRVVAKGRAAAPITKSAGGVRQVKKSRESEL